MPSKDDTPSRRYLALVPAAVLVVAGIVSFVLQIYVFTPQATESDYQRASAYVMENLGTKHAIRVYPTWTETPYPYLVEAEMQFVRQDEPAYSDIADYERIWLITEVGMKDDALASLPFAARASDGSKSFDTVEVYAVDVPSSPTYRHELRERLHEAKVTHVRGEDVVECNTWSATERRWDCARRDAWIYVGETIRQLGEDPRKCIWAHPPPDDYWVEVRFPGVTLGDRFRVRAGPTDHAWRSDRGPAIEIEVEIGDQTARHVFPPRTQSWTPVDVDTSSMTGQEKDVVVRVHANPIWERFFCFNGWAIDGEVPSP
ncbi:MAG: hypothetical protein ACQEVA_14420 [Myxococcota bacterium]